MTTCGSNAQIFNNRKEDKGSTFFTMVHLMPSVSSNTSILADFLLLNFIRCLIYAY